MIPIEKISRRDDCRNCHDKEHLFRWLSLGNQPLANNLLSEIGAPEDFFPLDVWYCTSCELIQLRDVVSPKLLFDDYLYYSSTSPVFVEHFKKLAEKQIYAGTVKKGDLIVDVGSNDGILLKPFAEFGCQVVGVEPAAEIANFANKNGIPTINAWWDDAVSEEILKKYGKAKFICFTNVFAHLDNPGKVLEAVKNLLDKDGLLLIEVPYLPEMLKQGTFDLVYHEHLNYFHLSSLKDLLARRGFYIVHYEFVPVHGGSIRIYATPYFEPATSRAEDFGLITTELFKSFPGKVVEIKNNICKTLERINPDKSIVGYGAPAKMSTMLNFFLPDDMASRYFKFIIDDSPAKQGKFSPGNHLRIMPPPEDLNQLADYLFLFAWNFKNSIIQKLRRKGYEGKFIIPFPKLTIT